MTRGGSTATRAARAEPKAERPDRLLGVGLTSRRNLCVHERVSQQTERQNVDQVRVRVS